MTDLHRLTNLPGYDTAPDVYETPDSSASTTLTAQTRSPSTSPPTSSSSSSDEDEDDVAGISHRRLYPEEARSRFQAGSRRVEVGKVDLSERVDGRRRGYKVRRRRGSDGDGDAEVESLEKRVARLRREVEECRVLAQVETAGGEEGGGEDGIGEGELERLSRVLAEVEVPAPRQRRPPVQSLEGVGDLEYDVTDEQLLGRVTAFDQRLAALEQSLGLSALDATTTTDALAMPVLPSLSLLDQQLSALASASSVANLEAASARVQKLRSEAEQHASTKDDTTTTSMSEDDLSKLHSLFQILPTLQSLAPTVPALLTRLRSLRTLHTSAAHAASELDEVANSQRAMDQELEQWKSGLERLEQVVRQASEANGMNGKVVEGWVVELEGRMGALR